MRTTNSPGKIFLTAVVLSVHLLGLTVLTPSASAAPRVKTCAEGNDLACIQDQLNALDTKLDVLLGYRPVTVFVTSAPYTGNLVAEANSLSLGTFDNAQGVAAADAICQYHAVNATPPLPGNFMAWIATSDADDPASRFFHSHVPYVQVNGEPVAYNWADLTDGTVNTQPYIDENGDEINGGLYIEEDVRTNVLSNGEVDGTDAADHCNGWASTSGAGRWGWTQKHETNDWWTDFNPGDGGECDNTDNYFLICFSQ